MGNYGEIFKEVEEGNEKEGTLKEEKEVEETEEETEEEGKEKSGEEIGEINEESEEVERDEFNEEDFSEGDFFSISSEGNPPVLQPTSILEDNLEDIVGTVQEHPKTTASKERLYEEADYLHGRGYEIEERETKRRETTRTFPVFPEPEEISKPVEMRRAQKNQEKMVWGEMETSEPSKYQTIEKKVVERETKLPFERRRKI